jgi:DNA-binding transcriptional LysR family regulator
MNGEIELRHLRYFVAVAEDLHFGHAAKRLHISQPPLSQQIRQLEELVGHALFQRTSRTVKLTAVGAALLERTRRTLLRIEEDLDFVRRVGRGETGSLRVGFIGSGMLTRLPAILGEYRRLYPDVELRLREFYTSSLIEALRDGSVDVAFLRDGGPIEDLCVDSVLEESFVAVVPQHHRLAKHSSIRAAQLKDEPFVFYAKSAGGTAWERTMTLCREDGFEAKIVQEAPHWVTILSLVSAGLGVTIAPECIRKIAGDGTVCLPLAGSHATQIELAYRKEENSPVMREFCRLARLRFAEKTNPESPCDLLQ